MSLRILLVEDNIANRDMLSRRLRRRGHEVSYAVLVRPPRPHSCNPELASQLPQGL